MVLCWQKKYLPPSKPSLVQEYMKRKKARLKMQQILNPAASMSGAHIAGQDGTGLTDSHGFLSQRSDVLPWGTKRGK